MRFHTNLNILLNTGWININDYNWFMSDLDVINFADYEGIELPLDFSDEFHIPNQKNFETVVDSELQIIWGVISAVKNEMPKFNINDLPYVEGNDNVWENDYFQITNAIMEITAWDSSYTIVKFRDAELSRKFKEYFDEAIPLEQFK
ncbi:MAG: hypothetical protein V4638_11410 [Bacteroidota bacterium]